MQRCSFLVGLRFSLVITSMHTYELPAPESNITRTVSDPTLAKRVRCNVLASVISELMLFSTLELGKRSTVNLALSHIEVWCLAWQFQHPLHLHCDAACLVPVQFQNRPFLWITARRATTSSTFVQLWLEWSYKLQYTQVGLWFGLDLPLFLRSIFSVSLPWAVLMGVARVVPWVFVYPAWIPAFL